ncbi:MAG: hypothetical protein IJ506_00640 [Clostridia bacterium]|nr:hypothetical protein [Clostridia bacterium]MBQ8657626.1 hypothetical protein [Clostridia bacterium]
MERKANTPMRETRRRYEEKHKEERKAANKVFGTSIPRKACEEIDDFLKAHNISKVDLIYAGYEALKQNIQK